MMDLIQDLEREGGMIALTDQNLYVHPLLGKFLNVLPKDQRENVLALLCNTWTVGLQRIKAEDDLSIIPDGYVTFPNPWEGVQTLTFLHYWGEVVAEKLLLDLKSLTELEAEVGGGHLHTSARSDLKSSQYHPLWRVLNRLKDAIKSCHDSVNRGETPPNAIKLMMDAEMLKVVLFKGRNYRDWLRSKDRKQKLVLTLTLKVLRRVKPKDNTSHMSYEDW